MDKKQGNTPSVEPKPLTVNTTEVSVPAIHEQKKKATHSVTAASSQFQLLSLAKAMLFLASLIFSALCLFLNPIAN